MSGPEETLSEELANKFGAAEYGVFGAVLALSAAVGIYYGCFGSKQKTTEEFLMAGRQMSSVPVALSLLCSFVSAITLLGNPSEVYFYGTQYGLIVFSFIPLTLAVMYLYAPVYFNLQLSSAYEYLEMRFSKRTRIFVSALAIVHLTIYMSIVVLGPSLALEQVTGIETRVSTAAIFLVCIFYSSLGGLKAVLWTDALQAVIMVGSLAVVVIKGAIDVGGMEIVWERALNTSRIEFLNFDPDPRTRHTFWTSIVGGYFMWIPLYGATQSQVQRYLSLPSLRSCRRALWMNMVGLIVVVGLCSIGGLVIYAKYFECDPLKNKDVTSPDQLLPLMVMETSGNIPGLPGLFVAGLTCASLSSVSSGINSLASIVTYDYLKNAFPLWSDERFSNISKLLSVGFGAVSFGFVFIAENMGSILPATSSIHGMMLGPIAGIFTLGMMFPWANTVGSLTGMILSLVFMVVFGAGVFYGSGESLLPDQKLFLTTAGCNSSSNSTADSIFMELSEWRNDWKEEDNSVLIQALSVSYIWYTAMGVVFTVLFGLIFSFIVSCFEDTERKKKIDYDLFSPPMYKFWRFIFPNSVNALVEPDDDDDDLIVFNYLSNTTSSKNTSVDSNEFQYKLEPARYDLTPTPVNSH